jgi:hypothetical protein
MEPASGSGRFRISEGDWICSDPQYATHCGFAYYIILSYMIKNRWPYFVRVIGFLATKIISNLT